MIAGWPKMEAGRLGIFIKAYPPDHRARDLDNLLKAPLDALKHAGVISDDSLIDQLFIVRCQVIKSGRLDITINLIDEWILP